MNNQTGTFLTFVSLLSCFCSKGLSAASFAFTRVRRQWCQATIMRYRVVLLMGALRDLLCNCKAFHLGNRYLILSFQSWTKCESSDGREKMVRTMERRETRRTRSRTEMTRTRRMSRWSPQTTTTILFLFTSLAVTQAHVALTFPPARWKTITFFASYFSFWGSTLSQSVFLGSKI